MNSGNWQHRLKCRFPRKSFHSAGHSKQKTQDREMKVLQRIKFWNFKKFTSFDVTLDEKLTFLIGDNESGKSTVLLALDLVLGGSRSKVETIGLESLFNTDAVHHFLASGKRIEDLPILFVEVYLNEQGDPDFNGKNNSDGKICDGLRLVCEPIDELSKDIKDILDQNDANFPFEYYETKFFTFSGRPYAGFNRPIRHLLIDSAQINNEYATREYIKDLYNTNVEGTEKNKHHNEYRKYKDQFKSIVLNDLNKRLDKYSFTVRTSNKANLESDLTLAEDGITIENKGKGQQCFIKTEFALKKPERKRSIDILLLEEPENHLSHINMKKLICKIRESTDNQLFIATHSNLISARLDFRRCILLNSSSTKSALLDNLPDQTAEFFMKAPDNNILEFILSKKVILVEGDAEYILVEAFYTKTVCHALEDSDTHVISVGGTSFKRYLDLARLLKIKTAIIRDNDGNCQQNCVDRYIEYSCEHIKVFSDEDRERHTFEICLYADNRAICDELFGRQRKTLSVQEYMLKNKAEAAFLLLQSKANELSPPAIHCGRYPMDKTVMLAVAGSGKTTHIVNALNPDTRSLLITYTDNNLRNLRTKILRKFGYFPENISLFSYFTFLYNFCFKPFLLMDTRAKGINWEIPPAWTQRLRRDHKDFYLDKHNRLYHNRIAKRMEVDGVLGLVNQRIEKYFDNLFIDEIQDFAGHDFNLIKSIAKSKVSLLFVGDFYQHTFDTSRDGNVNKNLHDDLSTYICKLEEIGLQIDCDTLSKSYRCSPTVCTFVSEGLGITMDSHKDKDTTIQLVDTKADSDRILKCDATIKLFYKEHYKYACFSRNWGDSKGEDQYTDVCVVLNKGTFQKFQKNELRELKPQTRNKLYVACSRARNNLYFVPEDLYKQSLNPYS